MNNPAENEEDDFLVRVPWFAKVVLGTAGTALILYKAPIQACLYLFFMIVVIPMSLLFSLGLIGKGTIEAFSGNFQATMDLFTKKVNEHRDNLNLNNEPDNLQFRS